MKRPRKRQTGSVWLRGSSFFLRFYDEHGKRKTEFLCEKDEKHYSATCPSVKDLVAEKIEKVNRTNARPGEARTGRRVLGERIQTVGEGEPATLDLRRLREHIKISGFTKPSKANEAS